MKSKEIKFKRGFKKKTKKEIIEILNKTIKKSNIKDEQLIKLVKNFKLIPNPKDELDWLAQYNETGQTCNDFIEEAPFVSLKDLSTKTFIYYIQIGDFSKTNLNFIDLIEYSKFFFSEHSIKLMPLKIDIIKELNGKQTEYKAKYLDKSIKLKHRYEVKTDRLQILAPSLFGLLRKIKPKDAHCLIGFGEVDFYSEPSDLFVAGLCHGAQFVGAFSCYRYDPSIKYSEEFWYETAKLKLENNQKNLLLTRSCKLLVHETCHLLGIDHCVFMDCCMNGSGHLQEDFRQSMFLCPIDLKKLSYLLEFDPIERYEKLKSFFVKIGSKDEEKWLAETISLLKSTL